MKVELRLTNHKTSLEEQQEHLNSEISEFNDDILNKNYLGAIDELIDVAKCSLKLASQLCDNQCVEFNDMLLNNHNKNEKRGYHK